MQGFSHAPATLPAVVLERLGESTTPAASPAPATAASAATLPRAAMITLVTPATVGLPIQWCHTPHSKASCM
jgi:hypothetical protein